PYMQPAPVSVGQSPLPPESGGAPAADFYATHPDFYGHYDHSYENPVMLASPQMIISRFAKLELTEDASGGTTKRYNVTLNGLPLILVDNQPAVIGVSRTYQLGGEDVIIFTSYDDTSTICPYSYHMLILSAENSKSLELHNCTRGYQAKEADDSLFITFPEADDGRMVGNTWRYEKGNLQKL
nr:hypothetical protein [Pseudomonadota bacterium]